MDSSRPGDGMYTTWLIGILVLGYRGLVNSSLQSTVYGCYAKYKEVGAILKLYASSWSVLGRHTLHRLHSTLDQGTVLGIGSRTGKAFSSRRILRLRFNTNYPILPPSSRFRVHTVHAADKYHSTIRKLDMPSLLTETTPLRPYPTAAIARGPGRKMTAREKADRRANKYISEIRPWYR
ncbi:hypothetical protein VTK56DRAFT_7416 [Thermocarpiscus australiensis]